MKETHYEINVIIPDMGQKELIVANTDNDFDVLFNLSAMIAIFMTASDYEQFAIKNDCLAERIESIVNRLYQRDFADEHIGVSLDWWPDHTRHMECDVQSLSQELFDELCALLVNEYDEWRIQVVVYEDVMDGSTLIGSIVVWSNKFLVDLKLYDWMQANNFNFALTTPPRYVSIDEKKLQQPRSTLLDEVE